MLLGNGNGTFQAQQTFATGNYPISVAVGDVNGDGKPDLVGGRYGGFNGTRLSVLLNAVNGNFTGQVYTLTTGATTSLAVTGMPTTATAAQ